MKNNGSKNASKRTSITRLVSKLASFSYIAGTLSLVIGIALSLGVSPVSAGKSNEAAASRLRIDRSAGVAQQAVVTPSVEFDQSDTAVCWLEPRTFTLTGTVHLPPEYDPATLQTQWYVVNPPDRRTDPIYNHTQVSDGDRFSLDVDWPGVNPGDAVVEIHAGVVLLFNDTPISNTDGVDYYWYPWVCPPATATATATATSVNTNTATPTATNVNTNTATPTATQANTNTPTPTATATETSTNPAPPTATVTGTLPNTNTPTATATATATATVTSTATATPTLRTPPASSPTPTVEDPTLTFTATPRVPPPGSPTPDEGVTPTQPQNTLPPPGAVTGTPRLIVPPTGADLSVRALPTGVLPRALINLGIGLLGLGMVLTGMGKKIK